jgi:hypothetical protein
MNYEKHYNLLIETRRNRILDSNTYYEKHHILPKSMGGDNSSNNIVYLTAREHFIAHWLLLRIHNNKEMSFAFYAMTHMGKNQEIKSSRIYEEAKQSRRVHIINNNKKFHTNKKLTPNQIKLISDMFKGKPKSDNHRKKISNSLKNKPKSESHKKKLSNSLKNYDWSHHIERNKKISESNSGDKNGRSKNVYQYDLNGNLIKVFNTMKDALNYYNTISITSKTTFYRYVLNNKILGEVYFSFL